MIEQIEIDTRQYQTSHDTSMKMNLMKNLSKTKVFMDSVLNLIIQDLSEEKDLFIEDDKEDEDRIVKK